MNLIGYHPNVVQFTRNYIMCECILDYTYVTMNIYSINNIKSVSMNSFNSSFKTTVDHSKWAVTASNNNSVKWICIGDINRAVCTTEFQKV